MKNGIVEDGLGLVFPDQGTPQGAVISPLLANIYLDPLDHLMASMRFEMVKYADDLVIFCQSRQEAQQAYGSLLKWMTANGLSLNLDKTHVREALDGFHFLGYHFQGKAIRLPRQKSTEQVKEKIWVATRRSKTSVGLMLKEVNQIVRGWYEYYQLITNPQPFLELDQLLWGRLQRHLRKPGFRKALKKLKPKNQRLFSLAGSYLRASHTYLVL